MCASITARTSTANGPGCVIDRAGSGMKPLSATAAFSRLLSSSHISKHTSLSTFDIARKVDYGSRSTVGPHSLPTEIIHIIFRFVFELCIGTESQDRADDIDSVPWLDEDPLSPSLFPYALACVCFRWFQILSITPVYWTRIVITLDAITSSLNAARIMVEWAGDCPLQVIATSHHGALENRDPERTSVVRVMNFLRPHINQIRTLAFDVELSSSIPALWRERGRARYLKALTLMSRSDAGPNPAGNSHEYDVKLEVPHLDRVTLGGHFLKNQLMAHLSLAVWFRRVTALTICGDPTSGGNIISLHRLLLVINALPCIHELTVGDIHFDDNELRPGLFALEPAVLCLRRITGRTALRDILIHAPTPAGSREDITIIDCTARSFQDPRPNSNLPEFPFYSTSLTLASMGTSVTMEDIVSRWNGERLSVTGCPRISRTLLEMLHKEAAPLRLSHLQITDCDNFSVGDVIALVQSRETQAMLMSRMGHPDSDMFTTLAELHVHGRGPPISVKRVTWLAEHVAMFSWDTVARNGLRYVWDGSAGRLTTFPASGSLEGSTDRLVEHGCL